MANLKSDFLKNIGNEFGTPRKIGSSQSLYSVNQDAFRIYIRYSKVHKGYRCFFGLRDKDLRELEGGLSFICLLWDGQEKPLILPFSDFEDIFDTVSPAEDGQYKVQIFLQEYGTELYIARAGRFNVDGYFGFEELVKQLEPTISKTGLEFNHSQIQTLLGEIGSLKNYRIWIPSDDRERLDWSLIDHQFEISLSLPNIPNDAEQYLRQIDVIWIERGSNKIKSLYEVEHTTPVYSRLLRFNDIYLLSVPVERFAIVSNEERRSVFTRQINRPTFRRSGLSEICAFFNYVNVYKWYQNIISSK
ncbi:MAG: hypothetical protein U9O85_04085 [Euryarchaeota archaeon]|nr:hypothetical protein [Euryarchaeota archaeon]